MSYKNEYNTPDFQIGDVVILKSDPMTAEYKKVIEDVLENVAYCLLSIEQ